MKGKQPARVDAPHSSSVRVLWVIFCTTYTFHDFLSVELDKVKEFSVWQRSILMKPCLRKTLR